MFDSGMDKDGAGFYLLSYLLYVMWSVLFATLAVMLVRTFAPYACGSGIPEASAPVSSVFVRPLFNKSSICEKTRSMTPQLCIIL